MNLPAATARWISPPQVAEQLGIEPAKVIVWIRRGELRAVNLAENRSGRPRYRIKPEWLEQFLAGRETVSTPKLTRRRAASFQRKYFT